MQSHGWSLLFHDCLIEQLQKLKTASDRANSHGERVTPDDETRHESSLSPNSLPKGERDDGSLREFHVKAADPSGFEANANVKLCRALSQLIIEAVPSDPAREEYRQGNTMGMAYRHWRRAKIGRRFRLFFRYYSKAKVIVFAWVNDERTLRSAGSDSDPYAVFQKMLNRGNPPDDWAVLLSVCRAELNQDSQLSR